MTGCLKGGPCVNDEKKQKYLCLCKKAWIGEKCKTKTGKKWRLLFIYPTRARGIIVKYNMVKHPNWQGGIRDSGDSKGDG